MVVVEIVMGVVLMLFAFSEIAAYDPEAQEAPEGDASDREERPERPSSTSRQA